MSRKLFFFIFICTFLCVQKVGAEQTIINMPSSEVLPAGDLIIKDSNRFDTFHNDKFVSLTPSVTVGVGHGMTFSSAIGTTVNQDRETNITGNFAAKKVWFLPHNIRLTTGGHISPHYSRNLRPNSFVYSHLSYRIRKTKTTVTAGGYVDGERDSINNGGVMLGVEQIIIPNKLRFALDWLSSQDTYGRMGVGLKYRPVPTLTVSTAVIIPNDDNDNIAFNISLSKFIALDEENPIKRRLKNVD